jgi:hypothetical protein
MLQRDYRIIHILYPSVKYETQTMYRSFFLMDVTGKVHSNHLLLVHVANYTR